MALHPQVLQIELGGTNASSMSTSTGIVKYDGTKLVTSSTAKIDTSNRYTNTSQPAFMAYLTNTVSNVTGDNTNYTVIFDTLAYDQGSNFNLGTSTFTAPVTGKYMFNFSLYSPGTHSINSSYMFINTSGNIFAMNIQPYLVTTNNVIGNLNVLANMTTNDTCTFSFKTNTAFGLSSSASGLVSGAIVTFASGYLVC